MRRGRIIRALIFFCIPFAAGALHWPVEPEFLSSTFLEDGEDGSGRPEVVEPVLVFEGHESMRPYDSGKVVFRYESDPFGPLPGGEAGVLVLEHENGFQSIYSGIGRNELRLDREEISVGEFLRAPGGADPGYCRFSIRDAQLNQLVNPLILLPSLPDTRPPFVESVVLAGASGDYNLEEGLRLLAGRYRVYVRGRDPYGKGRLRMPYAYALYNLGTLKLERRFDALGQGVQGLEFRSGTSLSRVFDRPGYVSLGSITLTSGRSDLEISLTDVQGNEAGRSYGVEVFR